jgi:hypothetical protein
MRSRTDNTEVMGQAFAEELREVGYSGTVPERCL